MELENEFTVKAPIEKTWETLLDLERVGGCLPGAKLRQGEEEGIYDGRMKVKLGAMVVEYRGVARLKDVDRESWTASFVVDGREAKGQGTASATVTNHLVAEGEDSTKVTVRTDMDVTGKPAQFGRGIMADVADAILKQFAAKLEAEILAGPAA